MRRVRLVFSGPYLNSLGASLQVSLSHTPFLDQPLASQPDRREHTWPLPASSSRAIFSLTLKEVL